MSNNLPKLSLGEFAQEELSKYGFTDSPENRKKMTKILREAFDDKDSSGIEKEESLKYEWDHASTVKHGKSKTKVFSREILREVDRLSKTKINKWRDKQQVISKYQVEERNRKEVNEEDKASYESTSKNNKLMYKMLPSLMIKAIFNHIFKGQHFDEELINKDLRDKELIEQQFAHLPKPPKYFKIQDRLEHPEEYYLIKDPKASKK